MVRRQNDFIENRMWPFRKRWMRQAALLNAHIESFMRREMPSVPDSESHEELQNQDYLHHGDILPATNFALGWPQTYYRELLLIDKNSRNTLKYSLAARALAVKGKSHREIAETMYRKIRKVRVDSLSYPVGQYIGPGTMMENANGACRHKAAMLAICLQEAGIKARYVRGVYAGVPHAWVEAEIESETHIFDLSMGYHYKKPEETKKGFLHTYNPIKNVVWRRRFI